MRKALNNVAATLLTRQTIELNLRNQQQQEQHIDTNMWRKNNNINLPCCLVALATKMSLLCSILVHPTVAEIFLSSEFTDLIPEGRLDRIYLKTTQAVDLDQDGDLDILAADLYSFLLIGENDGQGSFTWHNVSIPGQRINGDNGIATTDLNGDGVLDILFAFSPGNSQLTTPVVLLSQMTTTANTNTKTNPKFDWNYEMVFLEDFIPREQSNLYGWMKVSEFFQQDNVNYLVYMTGRYQNAQPNGSGALFVRSMEVVEENQLILSEPTLLSSLNHPAGILQIADMDNDGHSDIILGLGSQYYFSDAAVESEILIFWGTGNGGHNLASLFEEEPHQVYNHNSRESKIGILTDALQIVDMNNDGLLDIFFSGIFSISWFGNLENRTFEENQVFLRTEGCAPYGGAICQVQELGLMDVNEDGKEEIIHMTEDAVYYRTMDGEAVQLMEFPFSLRHDSSYIKSIFEDFNGDGLKELVIVKTKSLHLFESSVEFPSAAPSLAPSEEEKVESSSSPLERGSAALTTSWIALLTFSALMTVEK